MNKLNYANLSNEELIEHAMNLHEALEWCLEYIDAIPMATAAALPTMPGFDRDYVNGLLDMVDWAWKCGICGAETGE
jgi:hypothetical protein